MKRLVLAFCLVSNLAFAQIDFVTVKECRDIVLGKLNEDRVQIAVNEKLREALRNAKATDVHHVQYGTDNSGLARTIFGNKENACIIATAWFSTGAQ